MNGLRVIAIERIESETAVVSRVEGLAMLFVVIFSVIVAEAPVTAAAIDGSVPRPLQSCLGPQVHLCEYFPLYLGNKWTSRVPFHDLAECEVTEQFAVNGFDAWCLTTRAPGVVGWVTQYLVFVDGWLQVTSVRADLDQLPAITGELKAWIPELLTPGEAFVSPYLNTTLTPQVGRLSDLLPQSGPFIESFPRGDDADAMVLLGAGGWFLYMSFSRGAGILSMNDFMINSIIVNGACDPSLQITGTPQGGWFEEGERLMLTVEAAGKAPDLAYAWIKDANLVPGASLPSLIIESPTTDDSGSYSCIVTSGGGSSLRTDPVLVTLFPAGSLPAGGVFGCVTAIVACMLFGVVRIARRNSRVRR